jgi:hypothetical protein
MTCPAAHSGANRQSGQADSKLRHQEVPTMPDQTDNGSTPAETAVRPTTYHEASRTGRTWLDARDRWDELTRRDLSARARATLVARGQFDPARHGTADPEPLTLAEHLEVLASGEVVARVYRHPAQVDQAVKAGASFEQIADATGSDEATVRQEYRQWAEGSHDMWASTGAWAGEQPHRFGMDDVAYAAAMARLGEHEAEAGQ